MPSLFKKHCAVLMKKLCSSNVCYLVVQGRTKVSSSKYGRFRHEMIGETQPEMESLEVVAVIHHFSLKAGSSIPSAAKIYFSTQHRCILRAGLNFS